MKLRAERFNSASFFCILLFYLLPVTLFGQRSEIRFQHLSKETGLSQNAGNSIVEDSHGFIWIGTEMGLNRYDGYKFKVFDSVEEEPNSLSYGWIRVLYRDHTGLIWVGTDKGLNRFDPAAEIFTRYLHDPQNLKSISNNRIFSICEDKRGILWIGTECGLNRYDRKSNTFTYYQRFPDNPNSISNNNVQAVYADASGTVWVGTHGGGLNKFDREKEHFTHYRHDPENPNSISDDLIVCIYEDRAGRLWIGTENGGLNLFERDTEMFTHYIHNPFKPNSLSSNHINALYEDKSGTFWVGTNDHGINIFNREKNYFINYTNNPDNEFSLSNDRIKSIYEDRNGGIWIGTYSGGVNIYNRELQKFTHYKHSVTNPNSVSHNSIRPIIEDRTGTIWIGTDGGGLNKFNRKTKTFTHFKHNPHYRHSLSDNRVFALYEDSAGVLWVGTHGGGLNRFNRKNGQFTHYTNEPDNPQSLSDDKIRDICGDGRDTLWIGTNGGGLNKFNKATGVFTRYLNEPDDSTSLSNNRIFCLYIDRFNDLWIGTLGGGLNRFNRSSGQFIRYRSDSADAYSLGADYILSIYEDKTGAFWIGTSQGLHEFDRNRGICTRYTKKDGLPDNVIYDILDDDHGNLWLSTNNGIAKFNPQTVTVKAYDIKDGLQSNEFNTGTGCRIRSGEILFGGINGFNIFHPDSIRENKNLPTVVITDFQLFNASVPIGTMHDGRVLLTRAISATKEITLSYTDNVFSFEFAALHYVSPDKNQYAYLMEGIETTWNYVSSNRRYVTYAHIPPGDYVFRVMASNNDGVWNTDGTSLHITIVPPIWQTWWFYLLWFIIIVIAAVYAYRYQVRRVKRQQEEEERHRVFSDVSQVLERGKATVYRRHIDADTYDYLGEGIKDITGYSPEEFSLTLWYTIVTSIELLGELKGTSLEEAFSLLREGRIDNFVMDFQFETKLGEIRWARDLTTGIRDEDGNCYATFGVLFDITDRKQAELELAQTTTELRLKNEDMETDLNMAREIQSALLSRYHRYFPLTEKSKQRCLQFEHYYKPATSLAGDFFDILPLSDNEVGILICDVMGHGARASLLTFFLRGLIEELTPIAMDTSLFMQRMNNGLNSIMGRFYTGIFATAFYGVVDTATGQFRYTNAGHPVPIRINTNKNTAEMLKCNGNKAEPAIGIHEKYSFSANACTLDKGDIIFFYTDGIYETVDQNGRLYGNKKLLYFVQKIIPVKPVQLMHKVISEIQQFSDDEEFEDDVCLVTMQVKKNFAAK